MSLIGIRNIVAPLQNRVGIVTLIIVTVLVGVVRLVTTSGPGAQEASLDSGGSGRAQFGGSEFGDADSTNAQIDSLLANKPKSAAVAQKPSKPRPSGFSLDDVLEGAEKPKPSQKPPVRGESGGLADVKKSLGL